MSATATSDAALIADLRERGLVGPISKSFLETHRQDRQFADLASMAAERIGGVDQLRRAFVRAGVIASDDPGDAELLSADSRWRSAMQDLIASGPDAPEEVDAPAHLMLDAARDVICLVPAVTLQGASVKLRQALLRCETDRWVEQALIDGDDTTLYARAESLSDSGLLIVDALAAVAIATTMLSEAAE